jgi:general L-amino acid transport system permease protein
LNQEAGFGISEGIDYAPSDTYSRAFRVGVINTLKVSILGIMFATVLGFFIGIARLSGNYLVQKIAAIYVECFRNVPLLLQILFWYTAVILQLPPVRQSFTLFQNIFINQRGIYLPWPQPTQDFKMWLGYLIAGLVSAFLVYVIRMSRLRRSGNVGFPSMWAVPIFISLAVSGWYLTEHKPLSLDIPALHRFNFTGGVRLTPEFSALLLGLSVYTSAFIAEIVRGGIQSVKRGQREAAKAIGLKEFQILRLVILPQALRIITPPLTNQYLNLAKNSSLAIAIGFPDLFNVGSTIMNQTGQSIPVFAMIMISYLIMSLTTSILLNLYNRKVKIVEQ